MMASKTRLVTFAVAALFVGGCGMLKKKQPDPAPSATVAVQAPAPVVTPVAPIPSVVPAEPEVTVADEAVATPEDFEDDAFEKVSDKTYKAELDTLKKEIEAK